MKISRILLIHPSHYDDQGKVVRTSSLFDKMTIANIVHMALPLLASYIPRDIDVELVEDCFEAVNFDDSADVVCISAQIMQHKRAIDIAVKFRDRGKIVLMGGYLPTMIPESVERYVDSICIGEGDIVFAKMLKDIEENNLQKRYYGSSNFSLEGLPVPRYDLIKKGYITMYPIQATRGCPYKCDYCSIVKFANFTYRKRPVDEVIRDIKALSSKMVYFIDDNLMEDFAYCKTLFSEMKGLGINWGVQTSINCANDIEMLKLAYQAGCRFVSIGMESLSQENLDGVNKGFNRVDQFAEKIKVIHSTGIAVHILIIVGLDGDTPETYNRTLEFLNTNNIAIAEFFVCTPYPNTEFGDRMIKDNRIIDRELSHYREGYVVFSHPLMSSKQIIKEHWRCLRNYYSLASIFKRIIRGSYKNKIYHLMTAIFYYIKIKRDIVPVYSGRGNVRVKT